MAGARDRNFNMNNSHFSYNRGPPPFQRASAANQLEFQNLKLQRGDGPHMELRLLVRGRNAGAIIGKSGSNIKRIKQQFRVNLFLTDSQSPERILSIMGDLGSICEAILDMIPVIDNNAPSTMADNVDLRILMHSSLTGHVVGRRGQGIRELQKNCGTKVKVYSDCCPRSTDRIVQINGRPVDIVNCITTIINMVISYPPMGLILPYDPNNFNEYKALNYGGFTSYDVSMPFQGEAFAEEEDISSSSSMLGPIGASGSSNPPAGPNYNYGGHPSGIPPRMPSFQSNSFSSNSPYPGFSPAPRHPGVGQPGPWSQGRSEPHEQHQSWQRHANPMGSNDGWSSACPSGQVPTGRGLMGHGPMDRSSVGQGLMGPVSSQSGSPGEKSLEHRRLDQCPGLGFHPVDARTVQVSIPKPLQTVVMGRRGMALKDIRVESKAKIVIEVPPSGASERYLTIMGTPEQLQKAQYLLQMRYLDGKKRFNEDPEGFLHRGERKRRLPDAPWMTEEIMKMKQKKRKLERQWRTTQTDDAKKAFRQHSFAMSKTIKMVKEEYYKIHGGGPEKKKKPQLDEDGNPIPERNEGESSHDEEAGDSDGSHATDNDDDTDNPTAKPLDSLTGNAVSGGVGEADFGSAFVQETV